ncbi:hypothetical protein CYMTET_24131 [Cymbomonas tetramitiformis]|uniref:Uncharacterized protein n=1 Tax=Cymbomonas tetramitiformis TaxID=36881 RepID=A0AAE0L076_9CHLO|nr:hypothetical protein CYMTET_24131 [Cymbomonas tetramitiformis]
MFKPSRDRAPSSPRLSGSSTQEPHSNQLTKDPPDYMVDPAADLFAQLGVDDVIVPWLEQIGVVIIEHIMARTIIMVLAILLLSVLLSASNPASQIDLGIAQLSEVAWAEGLFTIAFNASLGVFTRPQGNEWGRYYNEAGPMVYLRINGTELEEYIDRPLLMSRRESELEFAVWEHECENELDRGSFVNQLAVEQRCDGAAIYDYRERVVNDALYNLIITLVLVIIIGLTLLFMGQDLQQMLLKPLGRATDIVHNIFLDPEGFHAHLGAEDDDEEGGSDAEVVGRRRLRRNSQYMDSNGQMYRDVAQMQTQMLDSLRALTHPDALSWVHTHMEALTSIVSTTEKQFGFRKGNTGGITDKMMEFTATLAPGMAALEAILDSAKAGPPQSPSLNDPWETSEAGHTREEGEKGGEGERTGVSTGGEKQIPRRSSETPEEGGVRSRLKDGLAEDAGPNWGDRLNGLALELGLTQKKKLPPSEGSKTHKRTSSHDGVFGIASRSLETIVNLATPARMAEMSKTLSTGKPKRPKADLDIPEGDEAGHGGRGQQGQGYILELQAAVRKDVGRTFTKKHHTQLCADSQPGRASRGCDDLDLSPELVHKLVTLSHEEAIECIVASRVQQLSRIFYVTDSLATPRDACSVECSDRPRAGSEEALTAHSHQPSMQSPERGAAENTLPDSANHQSDASARETAAVSSLQGSVGHSMRVVAARPLRRMPTSLNFTKSVDGSAAPDDLMASSVPSSLDTSGAQESDEAPRNLTSREEDAVPVRWCGGAPESFMPWSASYYNSSTGEPAKGSVRRALLGSSLPGMPLDAEPAAPRRSLLQSRNRVRLPGGSIDRTKNSQGTYGCSRTRGWIPHENRQKHAPSRPAP